MPGAAGGATRPSRGVTPSANPPNGWKHNGLTSAPAQPQRADHVQAEQVAPVGPEGRTRPPRAAQVRDDLQVARQPVAVDRIEQQEILCRPQPSVPREQARFGQREQRLARRQWPG